MAVRRGYVALTVVLLCAVGVSIHARAQARDLVIAERRLALVVGNDAYPKAPLGNAVFDAMSVSAALRQVGFDVTTLTDTNLPTFERAVDAFAARLQPTDIAVFFFAGLFTEQLLEVLREPGRSSREVFFKVRERVDKASTG